jgi:hypothetical protein
MSDEISTFEVVMITLRIAIICGTVCFVFWTRRL